MSPDPPRKRKRDLTEGTGPLINYSNNILIFIELRDAILRAIEPVRDLFETSDVDRACSLLISNGYDLSLVTTLTDGQIQMYGLKGGLMQRLKAMLMLEETQRSVSTN